MARLLAYPAQEQEKMKTLSNRSERTQNLVRDFTVWLWCAVTATGVVFVIVGCIAMAA